ncbi:polysaccharide biosynthesis C-terminal domain-containing protein [Spirosoma sp.]|uniref:lipid II flippase MurJ n=1 Tax=Spirosoma sp. TaxID=1899569 RepID=UPI003B3AE9F9
MRKLWLSGPARSLGILISGQGISALAGLVYGKMTAIYIHPDTWGDYNLWFITMTLLHSLFVSPTLQAFKAALGHFEGRQVVTFYSRWLGATYLLLAGLMLLSGLYYQNTIFVLCWMTVAGQGIFQFGSNYLNASGQHRQYTLLQTGYSISTLVSFGFLVVALNQRTVSGLWQATLLTNVSWAVLAVWQLAEAKSDGFRSSAGAEAAAIYTAYKRYVWPLLSLAFWTWLINYADRYLIGLYLTDADVGQYAMGYSLGSKLLIAVAPLLAFLSPQVLQLRAIDCSHAAVNQFIVFYLIRYVWLAGAACFVFYIFRNWVGELLLSNQYVVAFSVGPLVAIGYLFLTSTHLLELKWYTFGQTRLILYHNVVGAVLNIVFNLLLIPRMGIMGAALATLIGFFGQFILAYWLFTKPTES